MKISGLIQVLNSCDGTSDSSCEAQASQRSCMAGLERSKGWAIRVGGLVGGGNGGQSPCAGKPCILPRANPGSPTPSLTRTGGYDVIEGFSDEFTKTIGAIMKRTFQPSVTRRKRTHGFLVRMKTRGGRAVIRARRAKGRKSLSV